MQSKQYFTKIKNYPHEKSTEPPFVVLETRLIGNKKTYKSLICRFLSTYCPVLSSRFCGETGIRTPGTSRYNGFQDRRNRPLCHLSKTPLRSTFFLKAVQRYAFILKLQYF